MSKKDTTKRKELMWRADMGGEGSASAGISSAKGLSAKGKGKGLPEHLEKMRTKVRCEADCPSQTATFSSASAFASSGFDNSFKFKEFQV